MPTTVAHVGIIFTWRFSIAFLIAFFFASLDDFCISSSCICVANNSRLHLGTEVLILCINPLS
jgi:hypothetical protein